MASLMLIATSLLPPLGVAASQLAEAPEPPIRVVVEPSSGTQRVLPLLSGEALPRIC